MAAQCQACQEIESSHPDSCCFSLSHTHTQMRGKYEYVTQAFISQLKQDVQGIIMYMFDIVSNKLPFVDINSFVSMATNHYMHILMKKQTQKQQSTTLLHTQQSIVGMLRILCSNQLCILRPLNMQHFTH